MSPGKKKLYLGVVGLCGLALIVDRMVPSAQILGPASIQAAQPTGANIPDDSPTMSIPQLPFPRGLSDWDRSQPIRDLFAPPVEALAQSGLSGDERGSENNQAGSNAGGVSRSMFASTHTLNAVVTMRKTRVAILGDDWVREGETFGGCKLDKIAGNQAVFSCYDGLVTLESGMDVLQSRQK